MRIESKDLSRPICIIPARGNSKRLPRKNIIDLCGRPLISWIICEAIQSGIFSHVYVSTDDTEIASVAKRFGAEIPFRRPRRLSEDTVSVLRVAAHMVETLRQRREVYSTVCISSPTAPLILASDFQLAYSKFRTSNADVLYSICEFGEPPQWALSISKGWLTPMFDMQSFEKESQELRRAYRIVGGIQFFKSDYLLRNCTTYVAERMVGYLLSRKSGVDIDTVEDLHMANYYLQRRKQEDRKGAS